MFFLHLEPFIFAKVYLYMNTFQNNLKIFCTSTGAKKKTLTAIITFETKLF